MVSVLPKMCIRDRCEGKLTSGTLGVPAVMLREEKDTFLDDVTITQPVSYTHLYGPLFFAKKSSSPS